MSDLLSYLDSLSRPARPTLDAVQAFAVDRIFEAWDSGAKGRLLNMATGTGKTFTSANLIKRSLAEKPGRVLFLCHQEELIEQAAAEFAELGIQAAIEQADRSAAGAVFHPLGGVDVVIGSKDTLQKRRLESWPRDAFRLLIADECHIATSPTFRNVIDHFQWEFFVGLTATAFRMDGEPLYGVPGSLVEEGGLRPAYPLEGLPEGAMVPKAIAMKYPILSAIRNGHLSPIRCVTCPLGVDLRNIGTTRRGKIKDFNKDQLTRRIEENLGPIIGAFAREMEKRSIDQAFAAFPDVGCSIHAAAMFNKLGISAEAVWGSSKKNPLPDSQRKAIVKGFKAGDYRVVCFSDLLVTGVNHRPAHLLSAKPTRSLVVQTQLLGRGTRRYDGIPVKYVIDPGWTGAPEVVTFPDVFLEDQPSPRVKGNYKKLQRVAKREIDPLAMLDRAEEMAKQDEERDAKRASLKLNAPKPPPAYRTIEFSPVVASEVLGLEHVTREAEAAFEPPAPTLVEVARHFGFEDCSGLSSKQVSSLVMECMDRDFMGLARPEQVVRLVKERGISAEEARRMDRQQAEEVLRRPRPLSEAEASVWRKLKRSEADIASATVEDHRRLMQSLRERRP